MREKETKKIRDFLLTSLALVTSVLSLNYLFFEFKAPFLREKQMNKTFSHMANLVQKKGVVKQRKSDSKAWRYIEAGQKIYAQDQIKTEDHTSLLIHFLSGLKLELSSETQVSLDKKEKLDQIHLLSGDFHIPSFNSPLWVSFKNMSEKVMFSHLKGGVRIYWHRGHPFIHALSNEISFIFRGKEQILKPNHSFEIFPENVIKHDYALSLVSPSDHERLYVDKFTPLYFLWKNPSSNHRIQISKDIDFKNPMINHRVDDQNYKAEGLRPGTYYWRILKTQEKGPEKQVSRTQRFSLLEDHPPRVTSFESGDQIPLNYTKFSSKDKKSQKNDELHITWEEQFSPSYAYELFYGDRKIQSGQVDQNHLSVSFQSEPYGHYSIRLMAIDSRRKKNNWSSFFSFELVPRLKNNPPHLISPEKSSLIAINKSLKKPITFQWQGASHSPYKLEVSLDQDFQQVVFEKNDLKAKTTQWSGGIPGTYYWRVGQKKGASDPTQGSSHWQWSQRAKFKLMAKSF